MKRYILFLIIIILVFGSVFFLLNNTKENPKEAGTVPGSYLYFVDLFVEKIRLHTAFRWENKISIISRNIDERLLEVEELVSRDNINQENISVAIDNIEGSLDSIFIIVENNNYDLDYIEDLSLYLTNLHYSFGDRVNNLESKIITELDIFLEEFEDNNVIEIESIDKSRDNLENILVINSTVTLINDLFDEINLNLFNLLPDQDKEPLVKKYRNEEFERLREEASVYNLNLPTGLFMTLGPSDESETIEAFRNIIKEEKEKSFSKYTSSLYLIEAKLYGDSEKENLSIDQWNVYQRFLSEAQAEFNAENFEKAKNLAKQAKDHIITILE